MEVDTIDFVTRIGNNATRAAGPGCATHSFSVRKIDDEVTNLGVVFWPYQCESDSCIN